MDLLTQIHRFWVLMWFVQPKKNERERERENLLFIINARLVQWLSSLEMKSSNQVYILDESVLVPFRVNALEKCMNQSALSLQQLVNNEAERVFSFGSETKETIKNWPVVEELD